jgi:hypothetical protein
MQFRGLYDIWSGQYESMQRVAERLGVVVPITIFIIFLLLYLNTRSVAKTFIIFLAVPFSAVGAIWFLHFLDYNTSIAVWVGLIALMGVDAETGMFMLLYLDLAYEERRAKGLMQTKSTCAMRLCMARSSDCVRNYDCGGDVHGPSADLMVDRRRRGRHEAHRRADDRRHLHLVHHGIGGLSRHLRSVAVVFSCKKRSETGAGDCISAMQKKQKIS